MRDGRAERTFGSTSRVDMDPLMVAGGVGELVDPVLGDLQPIAGSEVGANRGGDLVGRAE